MKLYAAGKITANDWRDVRRNGQGDVLGDRFRERDLGVHEGLQVIYVGPWFWGDDHGCTHVPGSHAAVWEDCIGSVREKTPGGGRDYDNVRMAVMENACAQIDRCDVVYARLDDETGFGTFGEIGYAFAKKKPIYVDLRKPELAPHLWFLVHMALASPQTYEQYAAIPYWAPGFFNHGAKRSTLAAYRQGLLWMVRSEPPGALERALAEVERLKKAGTKT